MYKLLLLTCIFTDKIIILSYDVLVCGWVLFHYAINWLLLANACEIVKYDNISKTKMNLTHLDNLIFV